MLNIKTLSSFVIVVLLFGACQEQVYTPKPIAYPRIFFPQQKAYVQYKPEYCPFSFEYPGYAQIEVDQAQEDKNPCWFNINFEDFNAKIYMSYKTIGSEISLDKVLEDAHKLKSAHHKKADYIDEALIKNKHGVQGELSEIGGNVATNVQFYLTDYEKHYLRGSLYFRATPNIDSIQPIVDFIKQDMLHVFESFQWE